MEKRKRTSKRKKEGVKSRVGREETSIQGLKKVVQEEDERGVGVWNSTERRHKRKKGRKKEVCERRESD